MKTETTGTVRGGGLQLDEQISLPEFSRVRVSIEALGDSKTRFKEGLKTWKQLCQEHPIHSGGRRYTRDELHERG